MKLSWNEVFLVDGLEMGLVVVRNKEHSSRGLKLQREPT